MHTPSIGLKGRVKVAVVNDGLVKFESDWTRNLWLDQGLNQIAETAICNCFSVAVKGTGVTDTSEAPDASNTYTIVSGSSTIERTAGTRNFSTGDEGQLIKLETGDEFHITVAADETHADVTPVAATTRTDKKISAIYFVGQTGLDSESGRTSTYSAKAGDNKTVTVDNVRTFTRTFLFDSEDAAAHTETPAGTNTYSRSGSTVTRVSGARNFAPADVGKVIHFDSDDVEAMITVYTDATTVTVDTAGTLSAQTIKLYGFIDYTEIGFSHTETPGNNLNVRVLLGTPVRVNVGTPLRSSDQLKVTYECQLTIEPDTITTGNLSSVIVDHGNLMSGNKSGSYVIESFATSTVTTSGATETSFVDLEPFYNGYAAMSIDTVALDPLSYKIRSTGTAFTAMTPQPYVAGSFEKILQGVFGLNDAISNGWRSLMIYDPESQNAVFTFLFNTYQRKDADHTFSISFKKSWARDLS